jgi:methyl-accepting chemotaxis protein
MLRPILHGWLTHWSIRNRILGLIVIPVLGFAAIGAAFTSGESQVARAFSTSEHAAQLSNASRSFMLAVSAMRSSVREFVAQPSYDVAAAFDLSSAAALDHLNAIEQATASEYGEEIEALRKNVNAFKAIVASLVSAQEELGFVDSEGLSERVIRAGSTLERTIKEQAPALGPLNTRTLQLSLQTLRRHELQYRHNRIEFVRQQFGDELANFNGLLDDLGNLPDAREQLLAQSRSYSDLFSQWALAASKIRPWVASIEGASESIIPQAEKIIATTEERAHSASTLLSSSQLRTRQLIAVVGVISVVLGIFVSFWITRGITGRLAALGAAMKQLASGDTSVVIRSADESNELGDMAKTLLTFRDTTMERERLAQADAISRLEREQRAEAIAARISKFEKPVNQALKNLQEAAHSLEDTSSQLNAVADSVSGEARVAEERVAEVSHDVAKTAESVEEIARSINEIAGQAARSSEVASDAVSNGRRTSATMAKLGSAADRIGEVIGIIQAIAAQTNLLALNATIESARAGEAGRGFSVVASEVKSLANQTASATQEIARQISSIQSAVAEASQALTEANKIVDELSQIASAVAVTADQQNQAVASITTGVNRASAQACLGAEAMRHLSGISSNARGNAAQVKELADRLALAGQMLESEVREFLTEVLAA